MPRSSPEQRKTAGRVMHEFKHGELKSGPGGKAGKVKSRRQAIAIALKEAGASKYESESENKKYLVRTKRKEARGETYQQEREGKHRVGARGRRESSPAMGRQDATKKHSRKSAQTTARGSGGTTKDELYRLAKARGIAGRSTMTKRQLESALERES